MRAHGTQKTKTKALCSHKTKQLAHGQQNKSPAMCKTGHEHAANENNHKPHVHTRHDNMKACSQWDTQAACHTTQDITWMHAANKNKNCMHTTRYVDRRAHDRANSRPYAHTTRQNIWSASVQTPTRPKLKTWMPGSEHHAQTRNKACRRESAQLEHTRSHTLT